MKNKEFVGIDVSKIVLDVFILSCKFHFTVSNSPEGYAQLLEIVSSKLENSLARVFFCFENTGRYSRLLSVFLQDGGFNFAALDALDLKRSMGLSRGKSDKKDARTIAVYAWRRRDELTNTKLGGNGFHSDQW